VSHDGLAYLVQPQVLRGRDGNRAGSSR